MPCFESPSPLTHVSAKDIWGAKAAAAKPTDSRSSSRSSIRAGRGVTRMPKDPTPEPEPEPEPEAESEEEPESEEEIICDWC